MKVLIYSDWTDEEAELDLPVVPRVGEEIWIPETILPRIAGDDRWGHDDFWPENSGGMMVVAVYKVSYQLDDHGVCMPVIAIDRPGL